MRKVYTLCMLLAAMNLYSQKNFGDYIPVDSIFFEYNTLPYQISVPYDLNCWQTGQPSKSSFNSSWSLPLAIVTDTLLPYPLNTNSSFTFSFPSNIDYGSAYLEYLHEFDTDTLNDFGTVEASYDHGLTWSVLKDSLCTDCIQLFWSEDKVMSTAELRPHMLNPSGRSNGWIRSRYTWWWWMWVDKNTGRDFPPDSISIRFTFTSDGIQTNKEGWMIDNIITG
jgi:hypothetical protein